MLTKTIHATSKRSAFTLTEILVVIAIIAILAALTATGVFYVIGTQQKRNAVNTIVMVDKLLQSRWKAVVEDARKENPSPAVLGLAGGDLKRAEVIWVKCRLVEAFPQSYAETQPSAVGAQKQIVEYYIPPGMRKPYFNTYQTKLAGKTGGTPGESAACLLLALKTLKSDGVNIDDQLRYAILTSDGTNKIDTLGDAWSRPLQFVRFDTRPIVQAAVAARPNNAAFKYPDPEDSQGTLMYPAWYNLPPTPPVTPNPLRVMFESGAPPSSAIPAPGVVGFHSIAQTPPPAPSARQNNVMPVIISMGRDVTNPADDLINLNLRPE